ncbi:MAG: glycosyltransferase [Acidobacteria bacterium]|nr:glycosyltransferase [Acidobacteriota bacterium]
MNPRKIFVTVGAQLPFDRMISLVDEWVGANPDISAFAQIGEGALTPTHMSHTEMLTSIEYQHRMDDADLIIAHSGTGSILKAIDAQRPIIVLARRAALGECRNEHQTTTDRWLGDRQGVYFAPDDDAFKALLDRSADFEAPDPVSDHADTTLTDSLAAFIDNGEAPTSLVTSTSHNEPHSATAESIVAFGAVDWWYHNRGHSDCQTMTRLAGDVPVLWVNSIGMRAPTAAKTEIPLARYWRKLKSTLKGLRRDDSGMWVLSPLFIPAYSPTMVRLNGWLLRIQIGAVRRLLRMKKPSAFITLPTAVDAALDGPYERVVYNRSDKHSEFPEADTELIELVENRLMAGADEVLFVSTTLMNQEQDQCRSARKITHGVDYHHFADATDRRFDTDNPDPVPAELAELPRPIIGFYGALDDYLLDVDLFIETARAHPTASVVIIGPQAMEIDRLLAEDNIHYLGQIPYPDLPAYAAQFDVGIMPWLQNDWIERSNPIKLKEYLALGYPIASIEFPELEPYRELVHVGTDHPSFLGAVQAALDEGDERRSARQESVAASSWESVAEEMAQVLGVR